MPAKSKEQQKALAKKKNKTFKPRVGLYTAQKNARAKTAKAKRIADLRAKIDGKSKVSSRPASASFIKQKSRQKSRATKARAQAQARTKRSTDKPKK